MATTTSKRDHFVGTSCSRLFACSLIVWFTLLAGPEAWAQSLGLRVIQSIQNAASPSMQLQSELVPINFGASISGPQGQEQKSTGTSFQITVPFASYGYAQRTQAQILAQAKTLLTVSLGQQVGERLKRAMAESKANSSVFLFDQQIRPKGSPRDMRLVWSVTVTDDGKVLIPDPKVVDPDPTTIYITYTSSDAVEELPAAWRHFDSGVMTWQIRKLDGTELTAKRRINTGGAFNDASDPDLMVNCLANRNYSPSCPKSFPDAVTLMDDTASSSAFIDYVRKLEPAYQEEVVNGETTYRPRVSISVDSREFDRTTCTYRNKGRVGGLLNTHIDRYVFTEPPRGVTFVNRFTRLDVAPQSTYDLTQVIPDATMPLRSLIVDPITTGNPLVGVASIPEVVYVAPLATPVTNIVQPPQFEFFGHGGVVFYGKIQSLTTSLDGSFEARVGYSYKSHPFEGNSVIGIRVYQACRNQFERLVLKEANYKHWARIEFNNRVMHQNANFTSHAAVQVNRAYYDGWSNKPAAINPSSRYEAPVKEQCSGSGKNRSCSTVLTPGSVWARDGRQTNAALALNIDLRPYLNIGWNYARMSHAFHPEDVPINIWYSGKGSNWFSVLNSPNQPSAGFVIQGKYVNQ